MPSPLDQPETSTPSMTPDDQPKPQLAISDTPAEIPTAAEQPEEEVHVLDVGEGNVVKLDKLGPMIINSDGVSGVWLSIWSGRIETSRVAFCLHSSFTSSCRAYQARRSDLGSTLRAGVPARKNSGRVCGCPRTQSTACMIQRNRALISDIVSDPELARTIPAGTRTNGATAREET